MFNVLTALAMGIVIFAITVGIGAVVLGKFSGSVADCPTGYAWNSNGSSTWSTDTCCLTGGVDCTSAGNHTSASTASQTTVSLGGELGTSGLASWVGAIVALAVGLLFIGALMGKRKY